MIGVMATAAEMPAVAEFFELFKTPWEVFQQGRSYSVILTTLPNAKPPGPDCKLIVCYRATPAADGGSAGKAGSLVSFLGREILVYGPIATFNTNRPMATLQATGAPVACTEVSPSGSVVNIGFNLFAEVAFLLEHGQPPANAHIPTLDHHIAVLREIIVTAGITLTEIPPAPHGYPFTACLTHDIDFYSLRQHKMDRTAAGFLYRATAGSLRKCLTGRLPFRRAAKNWLAAARFPFVQLGLAQDFWLPFASYVRADKHPATYFVLPYKNRDGHAPAGRTSRGRRTRCDVSDIAEWLPLLRENHCEIATHGIDSWHNVESARAELNRIQNTAGAIASHGTRMHWLFRDAATPAILEQAGFDYDATCGYNEAVGFLPGTAQCFKPLHVEHLITLPFQVQDTALFYADRMNLTEADAWRACMAILDHTKTAGGPLVLSWHDRSLFPERLWGEFYSRLIETLDQSRPWFATAAQVVDWFRMRRSARFQRISSHGTDTTVIPPVRPANCPALAVRTSRLDGNHRLSISDSLLHSQSHAGETADRNAPFNRVAPSPVLN